MLPIFVRNEYLGIGSIYLSSMGVWLFMCVCIRSVLCTHRRHVAHICPERVVRDLLQALRPLHKPLEQHAKQQVYCHQT